MLIDNVNLDYGAAPAGDQPPAPLTPPDCDLRSFPSLMLDAQRLRDSTLAATATGDGFRCAVLLWCAAWLQVPAASLPDDKIELARLAGYGRDTASFLTDWQNGGARGWIRCSDGRLYHPVLAEKARDAWARRKSHSDRGRRGNQVRWGSHSDAPAIAEGSHSDRVVTDDGSHSDRRAIASRSQRKKEEKEGKDSAAPLRSAEVSSQSPAADLLGDPGKPRRSYAKTTADAGFDEFWQCYPRKDGKGAARKAWAKAIAKAAPAQILAGLDRYSFAAEHRFRPMPATWLNDERWTSEPPPEPTHQEGFFVRGAI